MVRIHLHPFGNQIIDCRIQLNSAVGDQRPGAETAPGEIETSNGLPAAAVIASLKGLELAVRLRLSCHEEDKEDGQQFSHGGPRVLFAPSAIGGSRRDYDRFENNLGGFGPPVAQSSNSTV